MKRKRGDVKEQREGNKQGTDVKEKKEVDRMGWKGKKS